MKDKFHMPQQENIFYAKRNIVDLIYKSSRLEGIAVTFPDTQEIYDGHSVAGLSVEDVIKVNNLKHAWQMVFDTLDYCPDLRYVRQLNTEVGRGIVFNAGSIRTSDVSIGGTSWKPDIPDYESTRNTISGIMDSDACTTEKSLDLMLYIMRSQLFYDGNKRTAQLAANQYMISHGAGVISIPIECQNEFFEKLIDYYESGKADDIKAFLYETSIDGYEHERTNSQKITEHDEENLLVVFCDGEFTNEVLDSIPITRDTLLLNHKKARYYGCEWACRMMEKEFGGTVAQNQAQWQWAGPINNNADDMRNCARWISDQLSRDMEER